MNDTRKMTNRQLAKFYLDKAAEEDQKKVEAFNKTAFTDSIMTAMGDYTVQEFREAGKIVAKSLENYLSKARDDIEAARNKKNAKSAKSAEAKTAPAAKPSGANSQVIPNMQMPNSANQQKPMSSQMTTPQGQNPINYTPM